MQIQFEELVRMREILDIAQKNFEMSAGMPFNGEYLIDYINIESHFLEAVRKFYGIEDLTPQEIHERYNLGYQEYQEYKPEMQVAR